MTGGEARLLPVQTRVTLRDRDLPRRPSAGPVRRRPHTSGTMQWVRGSRASVIGREVRVVIGWALVDPNSGFKPPLPESKGDVTASHLPSVNERLAPA